MTIPAYPDSLIATPYEDLLAETLGMGEDREDRTGTGARSVFGRQLRFDLSTSFPLITTKRVNFAAVAHELLWFLSGDSNITALKDKGVNIWNEWASETGELGPVYGVQWRSWPAPDGSSIDQISRLMQGLEHNPVSRRHIVSAWNPGQLDQMALPPCHVLFQFYVSGDKLSCQLYQRSGDLFLGVPFNIASYSLLTYMVAHQLGLRPAEFIWTGGDCHIYSNHFAQAEEQLSRQPYPYPQLKFTDKPDSIFDYRYEDIDLSGYQHHPFIKAPVAV